MEQSGMRKTNPSDCPLHLLFLLLLLVAWLPVHAQSNQDNALILPGKSIGQVKLRMQLPAVEKALGKSTDSEGSTGRVWETWDSPRGGADRGHQVTIYGEHTASNDGVQSVVSIRVNSPFFHTSVGTNAGSSLQAIWKEFPDLRYNGTYQHDGSEIEVYADYAHGISFEIRRAALGAGASIPSGAAWGTCQAVSVYKVGSGAPLVPAG